MEKISSEDVVQSIVSGDRTDFSNSEITGDVIIRLQHNRSIDLEGSIIKGDFILESKDYVNINFKEAVFLNKVTLNFFRGIVDMNGATLKFGLEIKSSEPYTLNLSKTKLSGEVIISNSKFSNADLSSIDFIEKEEKDKFRFENNQVESKMNASGSIFQNAVFNGTSFKRAVNFNNTVFNYSVIPSTGNFFDCVFNGEASFNEASFDKAAFFNRSHFLNVAHLTTLNKITRCEANFSGVIFDKRCFFNDSKFSFAEFHNCEFGDVASFRGFEATSLEISKSFFSKGSDFLYANINNADKETFRIIKNEFLKINNQTEALHYHSKEMKAYEKELEISGSFSDRFLLRLNRNSNEYGLNWWRGVIFTLFIAIISYTCYLFFLKEKPFSWGWDGWPSFGDAIGETVKYFFKFFLPTHQFDFMSEFGATAINYLIDFLGRIFIGYGIYQTIQAFRKYGKG